MEIINNIEWFINTNPNTAKNKITNKQITKNELETIIFDDSIIENIKFSLPLNNNFLFFETRKIFVPITVIQLLTLIYKFYKEPLLLKNINKSFEENEEWKEEIIDYYNGDITKLTNYDVFTDICTPDFCGLDLNTETGEYMILIGPE